MDEAQGFTARSNMDEELKNKLVQMAEEDRRLQTQLASDGSLYENYPQLIRELHLNQANELEKIIETHGWPTISLVGKEGADAAWLILQHAISRPDFIKKCFPVFENAVRENEADIKHLSCLTDGIRYFSRKPQVYGHYFDWNEEGQFGPWTIEDPDNVNERRRKVGLDTIEERIKEMKEGARKNSLSPPGDYAKKQALMTEFLREVGWIT